MEQSTAALQLPKPYPCGDPARRSFQNSQQLIVTLRKNDDPAMDVRFVDDEEGPGWHQPESSCLEPTPRHDGAPCRRPVEESLEFAARHELEDP